MTLSVLRNSTIDWANFNFGKTAKRVERHHEREHQKRAIKVVLDGFKTEERGQLIMACGTGKTFTALKIAERMLAGQEKPTVLFLVPSIALLLGQTLREWTAQAERPIFPVVVCSDPKASRKLSDDEREAQGDGTMNALKRARDIEWLRGADEDTECRVHSNAKCLSEGVGVSSLDAIIILSPCKSMVEVVQAVGRVMRKDPAEKSKVDNYEAIAEPSHNGRPYRHARDAPLGMYGFGRVTRPA